MKLNKDEPFVTRFGDEQGIRFIQGGVAFNNAGNPLGKMQDGKLVKFKGESETKPADPKPLNAPKSLAEMDIDEFKALAREKGVSYTGNIKADTLRGKIEAA